MKNYNIELSPDNWQKLRAYLIKNDISFEPSECFDLIHIEINVTNTRRKTSINFWRQFKMESIIIYKPVNVGREHQDNIGGIYTTISYKA